jgi:hypothetical protein
VLPFWHLFSGTFHLLLLFLCAVANPVCNSEWGWKDNKIKSESLLWQLHMGIDAGGVSRVMKKGRKLSLGMYDYYVVSKSL